MAAIITAICIPWWTIRHEHERRQRIVAANALDVAGIMVASIDAFAKAMASAELRQVFAETDGYPKHNFSIAEAGLASVNLAEIEDIQISRAFRFLTLTFAGTMSDAGDIGDYAADDDESKNWAGELRERAAKAFEYYGQIQNRVHPRRPRSIIDRLRRFLRRRAEAEQV